LQKYLIVIHQYLPKWFTGTEQLVSKFSKFCKLNNIDIEILCFEPSSKLSPFFKFLNFNIKFSRKIDDIKVHYVHGPVNNFDFEPNSKIYKTIIQKINPKKIIIFHSMRNSSVIFEAIKSQIPYSLVLTDYFLLCPHYSLVDGNNDVCLNSNHGIKCNLICKYDKSKILNRIEKSKKILDNCENIYVSSEYFKKIFAGHLSIDRHKFITLDYGSSTSKSYQIKKNENFKLGYFGSFNLTKGIVELIYFLRKSKQNNGFVFLGSGPLEKEIKQLTIENKNIILKNPVDNSKLRDEIAKIDIGILLSKWPENNPLIISEFLNCGKPVIVSNKGSLPHQIDHKKNGYVLQDSNIESIEEAINFCKNNYISLSKEAMYKQDTHQDIFLNNLLTYLKK